MTKSITVFLIISIVGVIHAQNSALDELRNKLEGGEVLQGEMVHVFEDQYTGNIEEHTGKIWIGKDRYKIDVGTQQVLVIDNISRVYNETENRLIISSYEPEEDDFAPSRLLNLSEDIFTIDERRENSAIIITLVTEDPFEELRNVEIVLGDDLIPVSIHATDQTGNSYSTTFREASFDWPEEDVFTLHYPESAEIVDLRE